MNYVGIDIEREKTMHCPQESRSDTLYTDLSKEKTMYSPANPLIIPLSDITAEADLELKHVEIRQWPFAIIYYAHRGETREWGVCMDIGTYDPQEEVYVMLDQLLVDEQERAFRKVLPRICRRIHDYTKNDG